MVSETGLDHWGRYRDRLVPADGGWRFAHRSVRTDGYAPDGWAIKRQRLLRSRVSATDSADQPTIVTGTLRRMAEAVPVTVTLAAVDVPVEVVPRRRSASHLIASRIRPRRSESAWPARVHRRARIRRDVRRDPRVPSSGRV